ncbi:MAG: hypothetical protein ACFE0I_06770 [Elainellaceae cyanobacterium]
MSEITSYQPRQQTQTSKIQRLRLSVSTASIIPAAKMSRRGDRLQTQSSRLPSTLFLPSGRNLDFCLLFLCSCLLTLLCHQISGIQSSATAVRGGLPASSSPLSTLTEIDFLIKAGLQTSRQDSEDSRAIID